MIAWLNLPDELHSLNLSLSFLFSSPPSTLLYLIWITEKKYLGWKRISSSNEKRGLLAHASMCYLNLPLLSTTVVRRFVIHHDVDFHNENELILVFISRRIITGWTGFYAATSQGYTLVMLDLLLRLVSFNEFFSPLFLFRQHINLFKISMNCGFHHLWFVYL